MGLRLLVDIFLELLPGTEEGQAFGHDGDAFAGFGITSGIAAVFLDLEAPESPDLDTVASDERILHRINESVHHQGRIIERKIAFFCQGLDEFAVGDRSSSSVKGERW